MLFEITITKYRRQSNKKKVMYLEVFSIKTINITGSVIF